MYDHLISFNGDLFPVRFYPDVCIPEEEDVSFENSCAPLLRSLPLSQWDERGEAEFSRAQEEMDDLQDECPDSFMPDLDWDPESGCSFIPYFVVLDAALSCARRYGPVRVLSHLEDLRTGKDVAQ